MYLFDVHFFIFLMFKVIIKSIVNELWASKIAKLIADMQKKEV